VDYSITSTWGIEAQIPFKITNTSIIYRRLDGTPFEPDYGNIHHRDETLFGFGDPWLSARASFSFAGVAAFTKLGLSLPLGSTEENPFELGELGLTHQHVQFGTGTVNPVLALGVLHRAGPVELSAFAQALLVLYQNGHGYRAGHRFAVGAGALVDLTDWLAISLSADLINEQPERWNGEILTDGNLGRSDLLLGGGVVLRVGGVDVTLSLRVPAWVHIIMHAQGEVTYPGLLTLAVGNTFSF
jgi:hypothetical protein